MTFLTLLDQLAWAIRRLSNSALPVAVLLLSVITLVSIYGVAQRLLGRPVSWTTELAELLQVALAFLPIAYVQNVNKHVGMELLQTVLGPRGRRIARGVFSAVGAVLAALLAVSTASVARSSMAMDEATVVSSLPIYPFKICVTVGFALLALQFAGHVWECIRNMPECTTEVNPSESHL